jgi:hypothetical protein
MGRLQLPTLQRPKPEGGAQDMKPESRRGTASFFFNETQNSSHEEIETETLRCYSGAEDLSLTLINEAPVPSNVGPLK